MGFCLLIVMEFYSDREPHGALFLCAAGWVSLFGVVGILLIFLVIVAGTGRSRGTLFVVGCVGIDREFLWNFFICLIWFDCQ